MRFGILLLQFSRRTGVPAQSEGMFDKALGRMNDMGMDMHVLFIRNYLPAPGMGP